jgi:hypothetical protein
MADLMEKLKKSRVGRVVLEVRLVVSLVENRHLGVTVVTDRVWAGRLDAPAAQINASLSDSSRTAAHVMTYQSPLLSETDAGG